MTSRLRNILLALVLPVSTVLGQLPPSTDIWLAPVISSGGTIQLGTPVNITNRPGYDNQPSFLPDGSGVLYTSLQADPPGPQAPTQTDIYRYDVAAMKSLRITQTAESEYSATIMPGGKSFSVVRVEPDSTQRLWGFDFIDKQPMLFVREVKPVGYHAWVDANTVALFVLANPATLQLATISTGKSDTIIAGIGRSLHKIPGKKAISFVHKISQNEWWIKEFDVATRKITPIVQPLAAREDYTWTPDGALVMGKDSKLFIFRPGVSKEWTEVADFSSMNIKNITRIAVSPTGDRVAFVAAE